MSHRDKTTEFISTYARFRNDPYGFVLFAYPWGKLGTFLAPDAHTGEIPSPDTWQIDVMETLRLELEKRDHSPLEAWAAIQIAVASGHGIGKTSLVAWLVDWFICTRPSPQIIVTAGTQAQLEKKTWRELSKWHQVSLHKDFFTWTATKYYLKEKPDTWFATAQPWSEHRSDSFAGTHEKYVMVIFDEASTIAEIIWEVVEGAMTTANCIWIAFGNPVRNTGRFRACFKKFRKWWITRKVDSRTAKMANKAQIAQWVEQYGEDSDFMRKRVKGDFPLQSSNQLISEDAVDAARLNQIHGYETFPIAIGVDVARFGDDDTCILVRQGRKVLEVLEFHHKDVVQIYTATVDCYNYWKLKQDRIAIFPDDGGVGGGLTDMLRAQRLPVVPVNSGSSPRDKEQFLNMRMEMWWNGAQLINTGMDFSAIPSDIYDKFKDDLVNIEYFMQPSSQKYQLESVDDLKARDLPSPDRATALMLTLAYPVPHAVQSSTEKFKKADGGARTTKRKKGADRGVLQKHSRR